MRKIGLFFRGFFAVALPRGRFHGLSVSPLPSIHCKSRVANAAATLFLTMRNRTVLRVAAMAIRAAEYNFRPGPPVLVSTPPASLSFWMRVWLRISTAAPLLAAAAASLRSSEPRTRL